MFHSFCRKMTRQRFLLVRNGRRLWDQFCEYTELPGFRFMTSKVTLLIRIMAIGTFLCSLFGMCAQLVWLIGQYLRNPVQTSSRKYRLQQVALPLVYLCHPLNGSHPIPLLDLCRESVFKQNSPDLAKSHQMALVVPFCTYNIKLVEYECELRCKWTSQGFCIEVRLNANSGGNAQQYIRRNGSENASGNFTLNSVTEIDEADEPNDFQVVSDYEIGIFFNSTVSIDASENTLALASVFLRFAGDAVKWPSQIPLVGSPHMLMERDALNTIQIIEILKITKNELLESQLAPTNSSYEYCVWRTDSELAKTKNWTCPSEFFTNIFARNAEDFANLTFGLSECAIQRAIAAQQRCREDKEFNRFTVESAIFTRSTAEREGLDPKSPNLRIYPTDVVMQETLHQLRSAEWKMLSEIGGTMALYLGFTLMSLLEAIVFIGVPHIRKVAQMDAESSLLARKNPPIKKFPRLRQMQELVKKAAEMNKTAKIFIKSAGEKKNPNKN